jgi:hypothetical protein
LHDPVVIIVVGAMLFFMGTLLFVSLHDLTQDKNSAD